MPSIVVAAGEHLFTRRPEQKGVLELRCVAALDVAQWRVWIDYAEVAEVLQGHEVLRLAESIQPSPAEGQCAEVLVDGTKQLLGLGNPK